MEECAGFKRYSVCLGRQITIFCKVAPDPYIHQPQFCGQAPGSKPSVSQCHHLPGISALCRLPASLAWCHSMSSPRGNPDLVCQPVPRNGHSSCLTTLSHEWDASTHLPVQYSAIDRASTTIVQGRVGLTVLHEMVPVPKRSPGLRLHPPMVW